MAWSDCAAVATPPRLVLLRVASKDRHSSYALSSVVRLALRFVLFHHLTLLARSGFVRSSTPASTLTILDAIQFRPHRPTDRPVGWLTGWRRRSCVGIQRIFLLGLPHQLSAHSSTPRIHVHVRVSAVQYVEPSRAERPLPVIAVFCCCSER